MIRKVVAWELPDLIWAQGWVARLECGHRYFPVFDRRGSSGKFYCGDCAADVKSTIDSAVYEDNKDAGRCK